jgi:hypothetical protein
MFERSFRNHDHVCDLYDMNTFPFLANAAEAVGAPATSWDVPGIIFLKLLAVVFLVLLNGFFVASEFAIVKVRASQLNALDAQGKGHARLARHITTHLDAYLSATQLGITLASLGLGWLGEPFLADMIEPFFALANVTSPVLIETVAFALAFATITILHIVLGELAPKSIAIRMAVPTTLWISRPLNLNSLALLLITVAVSVASDKTVIRVGHFPNITHVQGLVAHNLSRQGKGWFEARLGPSVEIQWFIYNAGPSAMEAIFAKSLELTYVGPGPALNAYAKSQGEEIRVIAGAANGGAALVVQPDAKLKAAADFKGKKIATPQLGNTQDISCRAWLTSGGLRITQLGGDAQVLPTQNPDQLSDAGCPPGVTSNGGQKTRRLGTLPNCGPSIVTIKPSSGHGCPKRIYALE